MLCSYCNSLFENEPGTLLDHQPSLVSMKTAGEKGCEICASIYAQIMNHPVNTPKGSQQSEFTVVAKTHRMENGAKELIFYLMGHRLMEMKLVLYAVPPPMMPAMFHVRERDRGTALEQATGASVRWLNECLRDHDDCQKNLQPAQYPTRLLEIDESTVRLVLPDETKPNGSYAALSYCWGTKPEFLRLTPSNIGDLMKGIPQTELPIVFQEALNILRALSIQYVWIDSLCIIQSGPEGLADWEVESTRMDSVYSNAVLTLAINRSASPSESITKALDIYPQLPFQVDTSIPDKSGEVYNMIPSQFYHEGLYDLPLGGRAWALQERIVTPRVLSVGLAEFFWDCTALPYRSESLPYGLSRLGKYAAEAWKWNMRLPATEIPEYIDQSLLGDLWLRLVEDYTKRDLSFPAKDKLAAISAIASRFSHAMDDVYIAGHFLRMLPHSLMWKAVDEDPSARWIGKRGGADNAPSAMCRSRWQCPSCTIVELGIHAWVNRLLDYADARMFYHGDLVNSVTWK
ncbi:heterokaryon incompatibility protein-domain-containing protein [Stachybotrys elegans]|uniref:Heterokaryon incompatibility protein-domain-containing protein n=1 Tax=Stachybotrys elegans TaxID=80388 RepID=A0A8K0SJD1_9HYPO|nr:heterokaryon incompatibility protein-domain-containing protein [Stachybotrys elegans]